MGVAGLVFEPPPPNFEKMHNFPRYTNDIIMKYGYFHWFKSLKKSLGVSFTDILVLLDLLYFERQFTKKDAPVTLFGCDYLLV